jgi:tripeptide aminopeptidase
MINQKELINLFFELVKIDSPTGEEEEIAKYIIDFCKKRNIEVSSDKYGNVIARVKGKGEPLLLSAHMDTVEPGRGIIPVIKNGNIKSSGDTILGADNKTTLAALLLLVEEISLGIITNTRPLELVFTRHEESENLGAVNLDYKKLKAKEGIISDAAKQLGVIITASPFYLSIDIDILGNSSHASKPEEANNSILVFKDALKRVKLGRIDSKTIANIGVISAGHVRNTVPGNMHLKGEVRSFVEGRAEKICEEIIIEFRKSAEKYGSKITTNVVLENPGYEYKLSDPLINNVKNALVVNKIKPVFERYYGCSDANIFVGKGIKVLNIGNGSKNAHTVDEEISVKDFERFYKLILSLIIS